MMESMLQEVTMRFYQSLHIEESLFQVFTYLQSIFPLSNIHVAVLHAEQKYVHYLASATEAGGVLIDKKISLSEQAFQEGLRMVPGEVIRLRRTRDSLIVMESLKAQGNPLSEHSPYGENEEFSSLSMVMEVGPPLIGFCTMSASGLDQFSSEMKERFLSLYRPISSALLNLIQHNEVKAFNNRLISEKRHLLKRFGHPGHMELVGTEEGLKQVMTLSRQVAQTGTPVLLTGETGTGKEVIANAIHQMSDRRDGPMLSINCGAIPSSLIESELFGYEKGAFTGATERKSGYFEQASDGTLFLDEVGDLPLSSQVKLLRVLQEKVVYRVGGLNPVPMNARIIAATHQNLSMMVDEKMFREDLWFRLNVFPIHIPPLRDRRQDIPALVNYFIEKKQAEIHLPHKPALAPGAMDRLLAYDWPGNIRELENCVERSLITSEGKPLSFKDIRQQTPVTARSIVNEEAVLKLDDMIVAHIRKALAASGGKVGGKGGAAEMLGLTRSTLRGKMRKYGVAVSNESLAG